MNEYYPCKEDIIYQCSWEQKDHKGKQDRAKEELIDIVGPCIGAVAEDIMSSA